MRRIVLSATLMLALSIPLMAFGASQDAPTAAGPQPDTLGARVAAGALPHEAVPAQVQGFVTHARPSGIQPGTALVTVGAMRYEFDVTGLCVTHPATRVLGVAEDGSMLLADFPVTGPVSTHGDPASIVIHDAAGGSWVADAATGFDVAAGSTVHSWDLDGRTVGGTAAFSRVRSSVDPAPRLETGTFAIACG
jgi:hypothetical protein